MSVKSRWFFFHIRNTYKTIINTVLGTVNPFESYVVGCSATEFTDYAMVFGKYMVITAIVIFVLTDTMISCYLQDNFRQFFPLYCYSNIKSVTIGIILFSCIILSLQAIKYSYVEGSVDSSNMVVYVFFSIIYLGVLALYVVKDKSSTFPFIRGQLEKARRFLSCGQTPVVPFAEPNGEEFNPRHLQISRISGGNVLRIPDNGGIYMGPSVPDMMALSQ